MIRLSRSYRFCYSEIVSIPPKVSAHLHSRDLRDVSTSPRMRASQLPVMIHLYTNKLSVAQMQPIPR